MARGVVVSRSIAGHIAVELRLVAIEPRDLSPMRAEEFRQHRRAADALEQDVGRRVVALRDRGGCSRSRTVMASAPAMSVASTTGELVSRCDFVDVATR